MKRQVSVFSLQFLVILIALLIGASFPLSVGSAQFIDRIIRPCGSGVAPRASVVANPNSTGDVVITTCTGGDVTINGVVVTPGGGTINPTVGVIPYKSGAATFGDSPLTRSSATVITSTAAFNGPAGGVNTATYSFAAEATLGLFRRGAGQLGVTAAGTIGWFDATGWHGPGTMVEVINDTATSTDGFIATTNGNATVGVQKLSPRIRLSGSGWKTNAVAGAQMTDWIIENLPVQGAVSPSTNLVFSSQVNAGGYTPRVVFTSGGDLTSATFNGLGITANGTNTFSLAAGKTLTVSNTITQTATDGATVAFGLGGTVVYSGLITGSGLTSQTARLLGRSTAGTGAIEEITLGTGLSFTGTTLNGTAASVPGGSDTQVQFNDSGAFGGDAGLVYNKATDTLTVGSFITGLTTISIGNTTTAQTDLLINPTTKANGNLIDAQINNVSRFTVSSTGLITGTAGLDVAQNITTSSGGVIISSSNGYGWASGTLISQQGSGIITLFNNGATDFGRLQFGGTTSSFPSLKRNGSGIDVRLADDSTYAVIAATAFYVGTASGGFLESGALGLPDIGVLRFSGTSNATAAADTIICRDSAGVIKFGTTACNANGSILAVNSTLTGIESAALYKTATNCADSAGAAACGSAAAGSVVVDAGSTSVVVSTTAVTADSQVVPVFDSGLGARLGVTCNSTIALPAITARAAGTSFTMTVAVAPIANPACFSYQIIN